MNFVKMVASTLALVSTLAVVPAVAQAAEGTHTPVPATLDRDRDHRGGERRGNDRDVKWGFDRAGHWGQYGSAERRDFYRDWRGYAPAWARAGMRDDTLCRVEWENGASPERMFVLGCFVR